MEVKTKGLNIKPTMQNMMEVKLTDEGNRIDLKARITFSAIGISIQKACIIGPTLVQYVFCHRYL